MHAHRGDLEAAAELVEAVGGVDMAEATEPRSARAAALAVLRRARGELEAAFASAIDAFGATSSLEVLGLTNMRVKGALVLAADIALDPGDTERVDELLAVVQAARPGEVTPWLRTEAARLSARLAAARDENDSVEPAFVAAEEILQRLEFGFDLAVVQLEHAEWLSAAGRSDDAEPLLAAAREMFAQLRAAPWLERAGRLVVEAAPANAAPA